MTIVIAVYITLIGLVLGSFYNVVGLRVPVKESLVSPPSHCPSCGTRLAGRDLIPVLSLLLARGKCRHCGSKVSLLYPLGELATGLLFLWIYLEFGISFKGLTGLLLVSLSVIITVSDLKYMRIPNQVLLFFLPPLVLLVLLAPNGPLWSHLLGAICGGVVIFVLALFGGMGMGDAKLFALLGWVIGFKDTVLAFLLACALGSCVYGLLLLLGKVKRGQPVPFGPWLAAGALLAFSYGSHLIGGYLALIR
ncbi:prepilin peptidase [Paenibacillus pinistramenti]|uniref:prepilin peptidase n=1 Tax=Paenibacillus pinistramenti TaxID=1768003 RepID=UPI001107CF55|nr:A24 family peptidase [Paenibacillus pinistramenti]